MNFDQQLLFKKSYIYLCNFIVIIDYHEISFMFQNHQAIIFHNIEIPHISSLQMKPRDQEINKLPQSYRRYRDQHNNHQSRQRNSSPIQDSGDRLRKTITKVVQSVHQLRKSYSIKSNKIEPKDFRMSSITSTRKYNTNSTSLKSRMDDLQQKVLSAKSELIPQPFMKKKIDPQIHQPVSIKQKNLSKPATTDSSITIKNSERKLNDLVCTVPKPKNFKPTYVNPYSPRKHNIYYVSEAVRAINEKNSLALQHIGASINMIKMCQQEGVLDSSEIQKYKLNLSRKQFYRDKKTLVLDLDETLIHCVGNYETQVDFNITIKIQDQSLSIGINIRPHAMTFLKKMAQKFQIIIFTASHETYADAILDVLDPQNQIFQHRLYRQHCFVLDRDQTHVKDLRIINRDLSEMVLVDNAAYSYAFQLENGIPILPFYYGADYQLVALQKYLEQMNKIGDVREINKRTFKLHHYSKFDNAEELIEQLYMNNFQ